MSKNHRLFVRALAVASLTVSFLAATTVYAQTPVYTHTANDHVTGARPAQNFSVPEATCVNCRLPDIGADNYSSDFYERPTQSGSSAAYYLPELDIVSVQIGADPEYMYFRINMFATNPTPNTNGSPDPSLPFSYAWEINFDAAPSGDPRGDLLVRSEDPKGKLGTVFGASGIVAFLDSNNNMGDGQPQLPDGPGAAGGGYETKVFDQGTNSVAGAPGGSTAVLARIVPGSPRSLEIAIKRVFLNALKGSLVSTASFRGYAAKSGSGTTEANFLLHDAYGRLGAGSPYPWLATAPSPAVSCPDTLTAENALTTQQRDALNSGTHVNTGINNPCYPSGGNIVEFDSSGSIADLASGGSFSLDPDLSIVKSDGGATFRVGINGSYTLTVTNAASASATTGVITVSDTLPTGLTFVSGTGGSFTCSASGQAVTCTRPAASPFAAGASAAITLTVGVGAAAVPSGPSATISNTATVATANDSNAGNNSSTDTTTVRANPNLVHLKTVVVTSDPVNLTTNPKNIPGAEVLYTLRVTNTGQGTVDTNTLSIVDLLPANTQLFVGDLGAAGSGPIVFVDGTPTSAVTFTFTSLASTTDDLAFSNNGGVTFGYTPTNTGGYDPAVNAIRLQPKGAMAGTGGGTPFFELRFRMRLQ